MAANLFTFLADVCRGHFPWVHFVPRGTQSRSGLQPGVLLVLGRPPKEIGALPQKFDRQVFWRGALGQIAGRCQSLAYR